MDRVILRRWKGNGRSVIALFPNQPTGNGLVNSYEHIGQHGSASYNLVMAHTSPVKSHEVDGLELLKELKTIGYDLPEVIA